jgi:hypothetical protein
VLLLRSKAYVRRSTMLIAPSLFLNSLRRSDMYTNSAHFSTKARAGE